VLRPRIEELDVPEAQLVVHRGVTAEHVPRVMVAEALLGGVLHLEEHGVQPEGLLGQLRVVHPDQALHAAVAAVEPREGHQAVALEHPDLPGVEHVVLAIAVQEVPQRRGALPARDRPVPLVQILVLVVQAHRADLYPEPSSVLLQHTARALAEPMAVDREPRPDRRAKLPIELHDAAGHHRLADTKPALTKVFVKVVGRQMDGADYAYVHRTRQSIPRPGPG
jgi:hypothetical protein